MATARHHPTPIVNPNLRTRYTAAQYDIYDIEETMESEDNRAFAARVRFAVALIFIVNFALSAGGIVYIAWLPCDEGGFVWNIGDTCRPSTSNSSAGWTDRNISDTERYENWKHQLICLPCDRVSPAALGMWIDGGTMDGGDHGRRSTSDRLCCKRLNKMVCTDQGEQAEKRRHPCPKIYDNDEYVLFALDGVITDRATGSSVVPGWSIKQSRNSSVMYNQEKSSFVVSNGSYVIFSNLAFGCNPPLTMTINHAIRVRSTSSSSAGDYYTLAMDHGRAAESRTSDNDSPICYNSRLVVTAMLREGDVLYVTADPLNRISRVSRDSYILIQRLA